MKLSNSQIRCLKEVQRGRVFTKEINGRDRKTFMSLLGHAMIEWDPIRDGKLQLTFSGSETLNAIIVRENAIASCLSTRLPGRGR